MDYDAESTSVILPCLTQRQKQCLECLAKGQQPKCIALSLGISISAVRQHADTAKRKLGCQTLIQAVAVASRHNLIGTDQ